MDSTYQNLSNIPNQIGTIAIDQDGGLLNSSGDLNDSLPQSDNSLTSTLYKLMLDINQLINKTGLDQPLQSVLVSLPTSEIVLTVDSHKIYGIKRSSN